MLRQNETILDVMIAAWATRIVKVNCNAVYCDALIGTYHLGDGDD
jgi:hypothetical protein